MKSVATLGYAASDALLRLDAFMAQPDALLVDIRLRPVSRWHPAFRRRALEARYSLSYWWAPELGNSNYADRSLPIELADAVEGLEQVRFWLEHDYTLCLLCACAHVESCHRKVVADLLHDLVSCEIVHL